MDTTSFLEVWVIAALITGIAGYDRKIGYWQTVIVSLLLSPVIGFIAAICSRGLKAIEWEQKQQAKFIAQQMGGPKQVSITDELVKLSDLREKGAISEDEFTSMKAKLFEPSGITPAKPKDSIREFFLGSVVKPEKNN